MEFDAAQVDLFLNSKGVQFYTFEFLTFEIRKFRSAYSEGEIYDKEP